MTDNDRVSAHKTSGIVIDAGYDKSKLDAHRIIKIIESGDGETTAVGIVIGIRPDAVRRRLWLLNSGNALASFHC
jgi:hypothetical protein